MSRTAAPTGLRRLRISWVGPILVPESGVLTSNLTPGDQGLSTKLSVFLFPPPDNFRYTCDICGKKYKYYSCFQEHRDLHAVDGESGPSLLESHQRNSLPQGHCPHIVTEP